MEQFVRDARIAMIYEGANGIQALDLVGRKLPKDGGKAMMAFFSEVRQFVKDNGEDDDLQPYLKPLSEGLGHLEAATMWFMQNAMAEPDNAGAGATDYMHLFGLVALGYMWVRMVKAADEKLASGEKSEEFVETKKILARFWMERVMPDTASHLAHITAGAETVMALPEEAF